MSFLANLFTVAGIGLRSLPQRKATSSVIVIGMACVVGVVVSVMSLSTGFLASASAAAKPDRAIVRARGAIGLGSSVLPRDNALTVMDAPGVKRDAQGVPIAAPNFYASVPLTKKDDGLEAFLVTEGITPREFILRPEIKLVEGRMFEPAVHEVIVGRAAQGEFVGLEIGATVSLPEGEWKIVGVFTSTGGIGESALLGDVDTLLAAFRRPQYSTVGVQLESAAAFDTFKAALTSNPSLQIDVQRESEFVASQAEGLLRFLKTIALALGTIMGLGALVGALNTMYVAVGTRTQEIATLRAIGFSPLTVVVSVFAEALALAVAGALIGGTVAWAAFDGRAHTIGGSVFNLSVTPGLVALGVGMACVVGLLGGLFPAIRAARMPIVDALRAT